MTPLGAVVGDVLRLSALGDDFFADPITVGYSAEGLLSRVLWDAVRKIEAVLIAAEFESYREFLARVEYATSPRWVYFSGLGLFEDETYGAFFAPPHAWTHR